MVARVATLYGRLPKAPFFLRQSVSPSLAPAFTIHNCGVAATATARTGQLKTGQGADIYIDKYRLPIESGTSIT